jgi:two-component system, OmpR family, sensor histidine kinase PhoQ
VRRQIRAFRERMWWVLGGLGLLLLGFQVALLRWTLKPLRRVARDLARVERGESERLTGAYPAELRGLTEGLNEVIEGERFQRARYRNTLSDLAHSLKTPLAVMRNQLDAGDGSEELRRVVSDQVARMNDIVAYQLSRAATQGHATFAAPLPIERPAEEIVAGLEKVYRDKNVLCEFDIDARARFHGETGDLMELLGNLLENAFKWTRHRVVLTVRRTGPIGARRGGVDFIVEDDGPGIAPDQVERVLQRGVRGDERVQGHGIGLAIVQDIVAAYGGDLRVGHSEQLGGAEFEVVLPPLGGDRS